MPGRNVIVEEEWPTERLTASLGRWPHSTPPIDDSQRQHWQDLHPEPARLKITLGRVYKEDQRPPPPPPRGPGGVPPGPKGPPPKPRPQAAGRLTSGIHWVAT